MTRSLEQKLKEALCTLPRLFNNRYTEDARRHLLELLFRSLTNDDAQSLLQLFPAGLSGVPSLAEVQGANGQTEYTEAARGTPCGHNLKAGEAKYFCATCTDDPTVILCARCFQASDHEGHSVSVSFSNGNNGCCDCGDEEAWTREVKCAIHSQTDASKASELNERDVPPNLIQSASTTISVVLDYFCDVISCSPENLKVNKDAAALRQDEHDSRLSGDMYSPGDEVEVNPEYCLVVWNDEKHTMDEVSEQITRACRQRERFGEDKAREANEVGRSLVCHHRDLVEIIRRQTILKHISISVTIRASRDVFREEMCNTIIDWLNDISGCSFFGSSTFLRTCICERLLDRWNVGSKAWNAQVDLANIQDEEREENCELNPELAGLLNVWAHDPIRAVLMSRRVRRRLRHNTRTTNGNNNVDVANDNDDDDLNDEDDDDDDDNETEDAVEEDDEVVFGDEDDDGTDYEDINAGNMIDDSVMTVGDPPQADPTSDMDLDTDGDHEFIDVNERMDLTDVLPPAPPPPPPPPPPLVTLNRANTLGIDRVRPMTTEPAVSARPASVNVAEPVTRAAEIVCPPWWHSSSRRMDDASTGSHPAWENLKQTARVDAIILFDLRLPKTLRGTIRKLLINTLIKVPRLKRVLGLRFAKVYNTLAQLYLVADREPDHSILHLSVQLMTTPSIAEESVEKANFLTNLMAILYTFLTSREVGTPDKVNTNAALGFETGAIANRRILQFFYDFRYYLATPAIRQRIRSEPQYLLQFLDLVKLCQGICPNVRAVGDHVEYENDSWIAAQFVTAQMNKHCREFAEAFRNTPTNAVPHDALAQAISLTVKTTMLSCMGINGARSAMSENKAVPAFEVCPIMLDSADTYPNIVDFDISSGPLSFHHPLHYLLSWLFENGKDDIGTVDTIRRAAAQLVQTLHTDTSRLHGKRLCEILLNSEDALLMLFDYPLRVCAWLSQIKAGLWVRNGQSLRHQAHQYRNIHHRDSGFHRDVFMLQTAFVTCDPQVFLLSMIARFGLKQSLLFNSLFVPFEDLSSYDVLEDFMSLLIVLLSDREAFVNSDETAGSQTASLRRDIIHVLCFKPLSHMDLTSRLTEKSHEHTQLDTVLQELTTYKAPEGLHDSGLFELKPQYLEELDPYSFYFTRNQREEAENVYREYMAKKTNRPPETIVLRPKLPEIKSKAYAHLSDITQLPLFTALLNRILGLLRNCAVSKDEKALPTSKIEPLLSLAVHLATIAALEDHGLEPMKSTQGPSFVINILGFESATPEFVDHLQALWAIDELASVRPRIQALFEIFISKYPSTQDLLVAVGFSQVHGGTASPAVQESEIEAKKQQAQARRARLMAQMQQQQRNFMDNQNDINWTEDSSDEKAVETTSPETRSWKSPSGVCIQCREETTDFRLYGIFAMLGDNCILRDTPIHDDGYVREVLETPTSLDHGIEDASKPYYVVDDNTSVVNRLNTTGSYEALSESTVSRGWPIGHTRKGLSASGCGHIMHYSCFEGYFESIQRRHQMQIPRLQPERAVLNEFVCPLCKALNNTFLPVTYKSSEQMYPGVLHSESSFEFFLEEMVPAARTLHYLSAAELEEHFRKIEKKVHSDALASFTIDALVPVSRYYAEDTLMDNTTDASVQKTMIELIRSNERLRESMYCSLRSHLGASSDPMNSEISTLLDTIANTITAVEVAYRARPNTSSFLLTEIGLSTLSALQVLVRTIRPYAAVSSCVMMGREPPWPFHQVTERLLQQLLPYVNGTSADILSDDAFQSFVFQALVLCPMQEHFQISHCLRICLTAEVIRVAIWWLQRSRGVSTASRPIQSGRWTKPKPDKPMLTGGFSRQECQALGGFVFWLSNNIPEARSQALLPFDQVVSLLRVVKAYALTFMRRAIIFLHVGCNVDFPDPPATSAGKPELERLLELCRLPSLTAILSDFSELTVEATLPRLASEWVRRLHARSGAEPPKINLLHPTPYFLVGLPEVYDNLIIATSALRCPTTGRELSDPTLCLFCGAIFCAQSSCCAGPSLSDRSDRRGGCTTHMTQCSAPIGIFLMIRKCNILFLECRMLADKVVENRIRRQRNADLKPGSPPEPLLIEIDLHSVHGCYLPAPYLTKFGETDQGLRSKQQLFLNRKRYEKLVRDVWLKFGGNGGVESQIARKIEADINAGGWETI